MSTAPRPHLRHLLGGLCSFAFFGSAYLATGHLLGWIAKFPEVPVFSEKWAYYQQHEREIEVLFVGSSRVYHQIIPAQFDDALAAAGHPLRSFNFAHNALFPPESLYLLRQILSQPHPRLKWVFIELMEMRIDLRAMERNDRTAQLIYWHDTYHTWVAAQHIFSSADPLAEKLLTFSAHLRLWLRQMSHLGSGNNELRELWPEPARPPRSEWSRERGYARLVQQKMDEPTRARFLQRLQQRERLRPVSTSPLLRAELEKIVELIRQSGAEPVFVLSPTVLETETLYEAPGGAALFAFNQPLDYPDLHVPEHFSDRAHLNHQGAQLYTDLLAQKFLELLSTRSSAR